jgi:hypothetical protein
MTTGPGSDRCGRRCDIQRLATNDNPEVSEMHLQHAFIPVAAAATLTITAAPTAAQTGPPEVQVHYGDVYDVLLPDPYRRRPTESGG